MTRANIDLDEPELACCEPIAMELLAGADDRTYDRLEALVNGLPTLTVDPAIDYRSAASIFRSVRRSGDTAPRAALALIAARGLRARSRAPRR